VSIWFFSQRSGLDPVETKERLKTQLDRVGVQKVNWKGALKIVLLTLTLENIRRSLKIHREREKRTPVSIFVHT
jgi:hypothetical protein